MKRKEYILGKKYDIDYVLEMAECSKENESFQAYKIKLKKLIDKHLDIIEPKGYVAKESIDGIIRVSCIVTLGSEIDTVINKYFETYDFLDAMMMNSLADAILFEATNHLYEHVSNEIRPTGKYLSSRIEPGTSGVEISLQKDIYTAITSIYDVDLGITEAFMLTPAKSLAYYYEITDENCSVGIDHDCSECESDKCTQRKYIIRVHKGDTTETIQGRQGENLLETLRHHNIYVDSPCGGKKICGKCKIKAINHNYSLTPEESIFLTEAEKDEGTLLACFHEIDQELDIHLMEESTKQEIEVGYKEFTLKHARYDRVAYMKENHAVGIGVDIGTTTVAVSLINLVTHEVLDVAKLLNPQKAYGADIISRIMYVGENEGHKLGELIRRDIEEMSLELMGKQGYNMSNIEEMVISGNTTMIYLLLEIEPSALAVAPFTTIDMGIKEIDSTEIFGKLPKFKVTILPWISAYVGGDIVSGLFATHLIDKNENIIFIDVGTNGEIVLKNHDRMFSAATATGPAFEGANIKCGMGAVSGAICEIHADGKGYDIETLGDVAPAGICGSALIDAVALLHKQGFVDDMGYMEEPVMFRNEIGIYPADIRQVQLAKAAIMAGVDTLIHEAGITYDEVDALYIAGGFGSHLNIENSAYIGLIPKEVLGRVVAVGNTSLAGAVRYLLEEGGRTEIEDIRDSCEYIELSTSMKFNECYVNRMIFGEDS